MKRVYELDVYKLAELLSDMVGILHLTGKGSIYIQEDRLKSLNHGCKN